MKVWIFFLVGSFVVGGVSLRRDRAERPLLVLGVCLLVAAALYSHRFA